MTTLTIVRLNRAYMTLPESCRIVASSGDQNALFKAACQIYVQNGDAVAAWRGIIAG